MKKLLSLFLLLLLLNACGDVEFQKSVPLTSQPLNWQNPINRFDVNNDGWVTSNDVLIMINERHSLGFRALEPRPASITDRFIDVDGDNQFSILDIDTTIERVNSDNAGQ